ncbi:M23 family metallopeptidase [Flavobacterium undicola]|uniref:M23 family metallopeptidase n=1 Tax=Flavobacterium undicola TaxID=1932779 RepID=UPI0013768DE3|nr:M23 family metallopeptidase [Flavobacterium undicola]MBA0884114.1 M23 family metallopeptidase [Flavobacterium undicola]
MRFFLFFLLISRALIAQTTYPKDYFQVPLDNPMQLAGNFGELRPNHFHAGFDFKTLQKEGLEVHAAADGYVSRIKISPFGNGKAIYINHPNGFTTVYCHLQTATAAIEEYIKKTHYKEQAFEIEMFPKANELMVKKGEIIALSGNTGSSEGPHLHFEFRDTQTEKIINPMLFGFDKNLKDTKKPLLSAVYVYPFEGTTANQSKRPLLLNVSLQKDGTYLANKVLANGKIGFGITADDYDNVSFSKNGVYKVESYLNGKAVFGYQFDTYSFDEMRYVNAFIDYARYKKTSQRVQKLFMTNPFNFSIIKTDADNGIVNVVPNLNLVYRIEIADFLGNTTIVNIPIAFDASSPIVGKEIITSNYFVKAKKDNIFSKDNMTASFPAGTFYDDFAMNFAVNANVLTLHDDTVPVHSSFEIAIESDKYTEEQKSNVYIASLSASGTLGYNITAVKGNIYTTKVRTLGRYTLAMDTTSPTITIAKPIEGRWLSAEKTIQLSIRDSGSGIKSYNGYLNGNWILFEYDAKTRKITYNFSDGIVAEGANDLKVIVTDQVGNATTFETHFFRSQK